MWSQWCSVVVQPVRRWVWNSSSKYFPNIGHTLRLKAYEIVPIVLNIIHMIYILLSYLNLPVWFLKLCLYEPHEHSQDVHLSKHIPKAYFSLVILSGNHAVSFLDVIVLKAEGIGLANVAPGSFQVLSQVYGQWCTVDKLDFAGLFW